MANVLFEVGEYKRFLLVSFWIYSQFGKHHCSFSQKKHDDFAKFKSEKKKVDFFEIKIELNRFHILVFRSLENQGIVLLKPYFRALSEGMV